MRNCSWGVEGHAVKTGVLSVLRAKGQVEL